MFRVLTGRTSRRVWGPGTIALSVAAHAVLFGGAALAASGSGEQVVILSTEPPLFPEEPPPPATTTPKPDPAPETPRATDAPAPTPGILLTVPEIDEVPDGLPPIDPAEPPTNPADYRNGPAGDVVGEPPAEPREPTGATEPSPGDADGVFDMAAVEELPQIANRAEAGRLLQRAYPSLLRDSGISGRVRAQLVIGADGRPVAGTARIVDASHDAFAEATLRVIERFRFEPAKVNGQPVRVLITLPIDWHTDR